MNLKITLLLLSLFPIISLAQSDSTFLLTGQAKFYPQRSFEMTTTGYFEGKNHHIEIDDQGNFSKRINIEGLQDIKFNLNGENITVFALPGDTILLNWEQKDFAKTFRISSPAAERNAELNMMLKFSRFNQARTTTTPENLQKLTDTAKFNLINDDYQADMNFINQFESSKNLKKLAYDRYFYYLRLMVNAKLLDKFNLYVKDKTLRDSLAKKIPISSTNYKLLNGIAFDNSKEYRDFLYEWLKNYLVFNGSVDREYNSEANNFLKRNYFFGQGVLTIPRVQDWYLAELIINGFKNTEFSKVVALYDRYMIDGGTPAYKEKVKKYYQGLKRNLSQGQPAPSFSLKDTNGKMVSLADLKGKLVYIDFWGVHCGPCVLDIKNNQAAVHEKYKNKEVVFVNICTDETESPWKKAIADLKMTGINLIAQKKEGSAIVLDYNVISLPGYLLIGRDGKIISSKAPELWELLQTKPNILDRSLTMK